MKSLISYDGLHCANCTTPIQGEFCYQCGQSIHSVLKPVHGMAEEAIETILHIDGRIVHTLPPLLLKPGFLTLEYFSGRRVRYIAPFRLMFVLCLLAFFLCHIAIDRAHVTPAQLNVSPDTFTHAQSPAEVQKILHKKIDGLEYARESDLPVVGLQNEHIEQTMRQLAAKRLVELGATPAAAASATAPGPITVQPHDDHADDDRWLAAHSRAFPASGQSPVAFSWLPDFVNARLNSDLIHVKANILALKYSTSRQEALDHIKANIFGMLPQIMFVLIPVFALLLKLFFVFKRRLYMEHLIVALHSHAFLFLCLLLGVSLDLLASWVTPHAAWFAHPAHWLEWALAWWVPIYLLRMQKVIYRQGWPMTALKYWFIGWCYFWLLLFALTFAVVLGMTS